MTMNGSNTSKRAGCLARVAALLSMVLAVFATTSSSIGPFGLGIAGAGLILTAAPAHATCLYRGTRRPDIPDADCLEAQRTNCVRSLLSSAQYLACLKVSAATKAAGAKDCIIGGKVRNDLSAADCREANKTGCVRRLLSAEQYQNCLSAQPGNSCVIGGVVRNDLKGDDCAEAKATGCVRRLLTAEQYQNCLDAQPQ